MREGSKITVYKIKPGDLNSCCEKDLNEVVSWIQACEPGEKITIEIFEMSEAEFNNLPEYVGP
jgi:hypothetical protein